MHRHMDFKVWSHPENMSEIGILWSPPDSLHLNQGEVRGCGCQQAGCKCLDTKHSSLLTLLWNSLAFSCERNPLTPYLLSRVLGLSLMWAFGAGNCSGRGSIWGRKQRRKELYGLAPAWHLLASSWSLDVKRKKP